MSDSKYNNAMAYTIATSEYRQALNAIGAVQAMLTDELLTRVQSRLTGLEDALRYELMEVFGVVTEPGELSKIGLINLEPSVVKDLNTSYLIGLEKTKDVSPYPLFSKVAGLRVVSPETTAEHSLVTTATKAIDDIVDTLEELSIDGDVDGLDNAINKIRQWVLVQSIKPKDYQELAGTITLSLGVEDGSGAFTHEWLADLLSVLTPEQYTLLFGGEVANKILSTRQVH